MHSPFLTVMILLLAVICVVLIHIFFTYRNASGPNQRRRVLLSVRVRLNTLQGVEESESFACPIAAQRRLEECIHVNNKRAILLREESLWVLHSGENLSLCFDSGKGDAIIHYILEGAPLDASSVATTLAPKGPPYLMHENAALDFSKILSVHRMPTLEQATEKLSGTAVDFSLVLQNQDLHDAGYYAVTTEEKVDLVITKNATGWRVFGFRSS